MICIITMIKLIDLLKENTESKYKYGCVMLYFKFPELFELQKSIDPGDVYTEEGDIKYGFEDEPHCTLLYGLHKEVTLNKVREVIDSYTFSPKPLKAFNISCFKNEKYDVLKFEVEGEILYNINNELKQFPYTSDFPDYHPHLTIAYLKPGCAEEYIKYFKNVEYDLNPEYCIYSHEEVKDKIKINIK